MSAQKTTPAVVKKKRDPDFVNAEIALKRAACKARQRAKQAGIGVVVLKDGRIEEEQLDKTD
jgi:LDH2 family malate/lactate/ureidoglycolate dehydrogenase